MKTLFVIIAGFGLAAAGALRAADASKPTRAEVIFDHPEKFTDVKDDYMPTDKGRDSILEQIKAEVVREAEYLVPEGCKLTMTFTDIDLAGDFEPWRGPQWGAVRVVKSIYPPAFKFSWSVTDSTGKVIKQGREDMRVLDFEMIPTIDTHDPLHFEKTILDDWMREHLRDLKKLACPDPAPKGPNGKSGVGKVEL
jgi:hypothetical protein